MYSLGIIPNGISEFFPFGITGLVPTEFMGLTSGGLWYYSSTALQNSFHWGNRINPQRIMGSLPRGIMGLIPTWIMTSPSLGELSAPYNLETGVQSSQFPDWTCVGRGLG